MARGGERIWKGDRNGFDSKSENPPGLKAHRNLRNSGKVETADQKKEKRGGGRLSLGGGGLRIAMGPPRPNKRAARYKSEKFL